MPDIGDAHWTFVDRPDGHSYEVWRQGSALKDAEADLYGRVTATMQGYMTQDRTGATAGPYTTLDEAAYPLALRGAAAARRLALERASEGPHGRPTVLLALVAVLAARALLAVVRRR